MNVKYLKEFMVCATDKAETSYDTSSLRSSLL